MVAKFYFLLVAGVLLLPSCGGSDDSDNGDDGSDNGDDGSDNTEPVAAFTMTPDCTSAPNHEASFLSTATDADGDTLSCSWTFSSGTPGTSTSCSPSGVRFPGVSPYNVTLTVRDGNGGTDSMSMTIGPC